MKAKNWSARVTQNSRSLILEEGVFTLDSPIEIAKSLKRSADTKSKIRLSRNSTTTTSLQSAMSMLNFYINRAGTNLTQKRRNILEKAKQELRKLYNK